MLLLLLSINVILVAPIPRRLDNSWKNMFEQVKESTKTDFPKAENAAIKVSVPPAMVGDPGSHELESPKEMLNSQGMFQSGGILRSPGNAPRAVLGSYNSYPNLYPLEPPQQVLPPWQSANSLNKTTPTIRFPNQVEEAMGPLRFPNDKRPSGPLRFPNDGQIEKGEKFQFNFPIRPPPLMMTVPKLECISSAGSVGKCTSAVDCTSSGGMAEGPCNKGFPWSTTVCCVKALSCGHKTSRKVAYFESPGFPNSTKALQECSFNLRVKPGVCQVRLDFLWLSVGSLEEGQCNPNNRMAISSNVPQALIPVYELCGEIGEENNDQTRTDTPHMYIHLGSPHNDRPQTPSSGIRRTISLRAEVNDGSARWKIRLTQIKCNGAKLQAPESCSQYYTEPQGTIQSLHWRSQAYPRNLQMSSCLKPSSGACAVSYSIQSMGLGLSPKPNRLGFGLSCRDYITFHGELTSICGTVTNFREMILPVTGRLGLTMVTDQQANSLGENGFLINYRFIHDCKGLRYFDYPIAKQLR